MRTVGVLSLSVVLGASWLGVAPAAQAGCPLACDPPTTTTTAAPAAEPEPQRDPAAQLLELANQERARAGVPALAPRGDVAAIAQGWSATMADRQTLAHNDEYFSEQTRDRLDAGRRSENVGLAGSIEQVHRALMDSPPHRENLLDRGVSVVGMGAVLRDGTWWVTQNFMQPRQQGGAAAAPVAAQPVTPAAPDPAPARPAPASTTRSAAAPSTTAPPTAAAPTTVASEPAAVPTPEPVTLGPVSTNDRTPVAELTAGPAGAERYGPPVALAIAAAALLALVAQRSWASASSRMRWRWSPRRTSSGWVAP